VNIFGLFCFELLSGAGSVLGTRVLSRWFQQINGRGATLKTERLAGGEKCALFANGEACSETDSARRNGITLRGVTLNGVMETRYFIGRDIAQPVKRLPAVHSFKNNKGRERPGLCSLE
jgi:hypothetical protein